MKKTLLLISMLCCAWSPCFAETNETNDNPASDSSTRLNREINPKRKRMPSRDYIEVTYDGMGFAFIPYYTLSETFSVTINDSNNSFYTVVGIDSDYYVATGSLNGEVAISCTSESGITYSGYIYIE